MKRKGEKEGSATLSFGEGPLGEECEAQRLIPLTLGVTGTRPVVSHGGAENFQRRGS